MRRLATIALVTVALGCSSEAELDEACKERSGIACTWMGLTG